MSRDSRPGTENRAVAKIVPRRQSRGRGSDCGMRNVDQRGGRGQNRATETKSWLKSRHGGERNYSRPQNSWKGEELEKAQ